MSCDATDAVVIFKSICNFIKDLNFAFGDKLPSIQLYAHLLERTGLFHEEILRRHISVFEDFVKENEEAILQRSIGLLQGKHIIKYSEKVFVDLNAVMMFSEGDDMDTVWTHLLTIFALMHPEKPAREQLRRQKQQAVTAAAAPSTSTPAAAAAASDDVEDPMAMIGNIFQGLLGGLAPPASGGEGEGTTAGAAPNPLQALMQGMMSPGGAGAGMGIPGMGGDGTPGGGPPPDPMQMLNSIMSSPMMSNLMQSIGGSEVDMTKVMDGMQKTISTLQTVLNDAGVPSTPGSSSSSAPVVTENMPSEEAGDSCIDETPEMD